MWPFRVLLTGRLQPALMVSSAQGYAQVLLVLVVLCDFFISQLMIYVLSHVRSSSELRCVGTPFQRGDSGGLFGSAALGRVMYECGLFGCCGLHAFNLP
jgi:hypothetical protein